MEGSTLPLLLPRVEKLQRVYFKLGAPIESRPLTGFLGGEGFVSTGSGDPDDPEVGVAGVRSAPSEDDVWALREEVREAIERDVRHLLSYRESDPDRYSAGQLRPVEAIPSSSRL